MMKIYVVMLLFIGLTSSALAQQNQKAHLLKNDGKEVQTRVERTELRQEIKNYRDEKPGRISISYYSNGKIKRIT